MIAVIADDLTGAAEMAGIAWRFGLSAELLLQDSSIGKADVLIVSTDSRSLSRQKALEITKRITRQVQKWQPEWVYKKTDSVLRGYVAEELQIQMEILNLPRAFVLPANPSLDRTISAGEYYVQGEKIHTTGFANDPEFPVLTSSVSEMLQRKAVVLSPGAILPARGIVAGEAANSEAIKHWAERVDHSWLLAGAGDFFEALLARNSSQQKKASISIQTPHLYISGTAFDQRKKFIRNLHANGGPVIWLPNEMNEKWLQTAAALMQSNQKLLLAIDESTEDAATIRKRMAATARILIEQTGVKEIFIEGGATAAAILKEMQISRLLPVEEWQRGVVRMMSGEYFFTLKPGSYPLPDELLRLYN